MAANGPRTHTRALGFVFLVVLVPVGSPRAAQTTGPDAPGRLVSYRLDVVPLLSRAGCNVGPCHGNLNGKGGFRLSLRGEDPAADWLALTHDTHGRRIDRTRPDASLLLRKPTGQVPHEGGLRFAVDSDEYRTLRAWIAQGAADDVLSAPSVVRLTVDPAERLIDPTAPASTATPGYEQPLKVVAELSDGTRRDVTRQATYELSDPTRAEVAPDGRVTAARPGEVAVAIRFGAARATARLAFVAHRPDFAWSGPEPASDIDRHVFAKLKALRINPSAVCDDEVFLRRVFLDVLGVLPTPEEAREFLADTDPKKRAKLVDRLLDRPEFADFWALKWADLLRNEEKTMGPKGVWIFQRWLRDQIAADRPMDEFARALLTSRGSTWRNPAASFYRTNRDPQAAAEAMGQVFLGVRLQCARCHNHPFDRWTQDDYYGLSAAFANVGRKQIDNKRRDTFDKHEINGDEVIYLTGRPEIVQPRSGEMMHPRPPGGPVLEISTDDADALDDLADWLTRDNPQFARVLANRVWYHLLGRGIVEPVDDFRDSNPASNPALLDALGDRFAADGFRLRPLVRWIVTSKTYQLAATPNDTNADDETNFSHAAVKLLPAEVLLDAIGEALETGGSGSGRAPKDARATQVAGVRGDGPFLKVFGKPERLLTCECERSEATTLAQAFQLINGPVVRGKLEAGRNRIGRLLDSGAGDEAILEELYLATLSRLPTERERTGVREHVGKSHDRRAAWEDVAWALVNSKEFLLRH